MGPLLVYHAGLGAKGHPPGSLAGLRDCLKSGARHIEVDITALVDGEHALLHDEELADCTDGHGRVAEATAVQVHRLHLRWQGRQTGERVACLSHALALLPRWPALAELQLDLKPHASVSSASLESLVDMVRPHRPRVRVSSRLAWALRRLHALDPELALGFDPARHIDLELGETHIAPVLRRAGAFGYLDDHALAADHWGTPSQYLAERLAALWELTPARMWCLRATLIARGWEDGFDWVAALHARGAQVTAWTLNPDQPHHVMLAQRLAEAGVDRIITDDPPGLERLL